MTSSKMKALLAGLAVVLFLAPIESKFHNERRHSHRDLDNNEWLFTDDQENGSSQTSIFIQYPGKLSAQQQKLEESKTFEENLRRTLGLDKAPNEMIDSKIFGLKNIPSGVRGSQISRELRRSVSGDGQISHSHISKKYFPVPKEAKPEMSNVKSLNLFVNFNTNNKMEEPKDIKLQNDNDAKNNSSGFETLSGTVDHDKQYKLNQRLIKKKNDFDQKYKKIFGDKFKFGKTGSKKITDFKLETQKRKKRTVSVVNSEYVNSGPQWGAPVWLGDGEVALRVRASAQAVVIRAEARSVGHVAFALGNDAVLAWLDPDGTPNILDCHLVGGIPMADYSQDYEMIFGLRNHTHLVVEFKRPLDTCDHEDIIIGADPIDVQWALGPGDPRGNGWGGWLGLRPLLFLGPRPPPPPPQPALGAPQVPGVKDYKRWDVMVKDVIIPENMATMFWCKVFQAPLVAGKHHIVGYSAQAGPAARHMVLHECARPITAEVPAWERWARQPGDFGPDVPPEWTACLTPVAAWAIGSKGEMFPGHVGIPLGEPDGVIFYMLEIHYENPSLQKVVDNSGITILYTDELRDHDAGIMVAGITVSALHVLPANQRKYRSAGYCSEPCTTEMFPPEGINVVSVLLHAHSAGRKLSLRHVRNGQELPKIAEDDKYNYKNQQSKVLMTERNVEQGDALVMECTYDTNGRPRPTLGGYSSKQEMCLSFILHYPPIPLAGCYSMTPVKEFFETFGVKEFYNVDMKQVESMFLTSGSLEGFPDLLKLAANKNSKEIAVQGDDQGVNLLSRLVIKEPQEFRNKTFIAHLNEIPWNEPLLTKRIEDTLYKGKHMTFCRKRDDTIAVPIEISIFPNFVEVAEDPSKQCHYKSQHNSAPSSYNFSKNMLQAIFSTLLALSFTLLVTK